MIHGTYDTPEEACEEFERRRANREDVRYVDAPDGRYIVRDLTEEELKLPPPRFQFVLLALDGFSEEDRAVLLALPRQQLYPICAAAVQNPGAVLVYQDGEIIGVTVPDA